MNPGYSQSLNINILNYSGPLDVLLDLAKSQKVDLNKISVTELAGQFHKFLIEAKKINLDLASEYLLMATWLTYLKSKLLLPESEEDDFKASEVAERSLRMVTEGIATAITGEEIPVRAASFCLHGDTPGALDMAKRVRTDLEGAGVQVVPLGQLV